MEGVSGGRWYKVPGKRPKYPGFWGRVEVEPFEHWAVAIEREDGVYVRSQTGRSIFREGGDYSPPFGHNDVPIPDVNSCCGYFVEAKVSNGSEQWNAPEPWIHVEEAVVPLFIRQTYMVNRVRSDERISFGDGGSETLLFPVWSKSKVLLEPERLALLQALDARAAHLKDFQTSVVEDIIDPSLFPHRREGGSEASERAKFEKVRDAWLKKNPGTVYRAFDEGKILFLFCVFSR